MVIQAPVVQIDRTDHCLLIVRDKDLCVYKPRRILVNLYTCFHQFFIISSRNDERIFLVRNMRHQDHHLDAPPRRVRQRSDHLVIQDQIRRHNMYIILGGIQNIQIDSASYPRFPVRTDVIRNKKAIGLLIIFLQRLILQICLLFRLGNVPHFQKHERKPFHSIAFQADRRILPVTEPDFPVNIFVCQIRASRMGNPPVDDQDFPMIPVVIMAGEHRMDRRIHFAADSIFFQNFRVKLRKKRQGTHTVIHDTHFHALLYLLLQHFQNFMPQISFFDNEVFHENKLLRAPQILHQRLKLILTQRIIVCVGFVVDCAVCVLSHIFRKSPDLNVFPLQRFFRRPIFFQALPGKNRQLLKPFIYFPRAGIDRDVQIKDCAEYRKNNHRQHPYQTELRVTAAAEQMKEHNDHQDPKQPIHFQAVFFQRAVKKVYKQKLYQKRAQDDQRPAEDDHFYPVHSLFLDIFRFHFRSFSFAFCYLNRTIFLYFWQCQESCNSSALLNCYMQNPFKIAFGDGILHS